MTGTSTFLFYFFHGHIHSTWKFLDQGLSPKPRLRPSFELSWDLCQILRPAVLGLGWNLCLCRDPSHCSQILNPPQHSGNAKSLPFLAETTSTLASLVRRFCPCGWGLLQGMVAAVVAAGSSSGSCQHLSAATIHPSPKPGTSV